MQDPNKLKWATSQDETWMIRAGETVYKGTEEFLIVRCFASKDSWGLVRLSGTIVADAWEVPIANLAFFMNDVSLQPGRCTL